MTMMLDYSTFTDDQRQNALVLALEQLLKAQARYAALNGAQAAFAACRHFPTAEVVRFDVEPDEDGTFTVDLVSVRGPEGEKLWFVGDPQAEEHPIADDSEITDRLATARAYGFPFPAVDEPQPDGTSWIVFELHVPTALEDGARASH